MVSSLSTSFLMCFLMVLLNKIQYFSWGLTIAKNTIILSCVTYIVSSRHSREARITFISFLQLHHTVDSFMAPINHQNFIYSGILWLYFWFCPPKCSLLRLSLFKLLMLDFRTYWDSLLRTYFWIQILSLSTFHKSLHGVIYKACK